jgi:hypothetical protein
VRKCLLDLYSCIFLLNFNKIQIANISELFLWIFVISVHKNICDEYQNKGNPLYCNFYWVGFLEVFFFNFSTFTTLIPLYILPAWVKTKNTGKPGFSITMSVPTIGVLAPVDELRYFCSWILLETGKLHRPCTWTQIIQSESTGNVTRKNIGQTLSYRVGDYRYSFKRLNTGMHIKDKRQEFIKLFRACHFHWKLFVLYTGSVQYFQKMFVYCAMYPMRVSNTENVQ